MNPLPRFLPLVEESPVSEVAALDVAVVPLDSGFVLASSSLPVGGVNILFFSGLSDLEVFGFCSGEGGFEDFQSASYPSAESTNSGSIVRSIISSSSTTFAFFLGVVKELLEGFSAGTGSEEESVFLMRLVMLQRMFWIIWCNFGVPIIKRIIDLVVVCTDYFLLPL